MPAFLSTLASVPSVLRACVVLAAAGACQPTSPATGPLTPGGGSAGSGAGTGSGTGGGSGGGTGGGPAPKVVVDLTSTRSTLGSTRATAYDMSVKIVSANGKVHLAWLDAPANVMVETYDVATGAFSPAVTLGIAADNHGGPALTMDHQGFLYAAFGPHHGAFQFRRSASPHDASAWVDLGAFGTGATYPSLVCAPDDTLHCTYRGGPDPRRLMYQKRPPGGAWSAPRELVSAAPHVGYTQYGNPLAVAADGTLHVAFHLLTHPGGDTGKGVGYLRSRDGGQSWETAAGQAVQTPVTAATSACFLYQTTTADTRIGGMVLDPLGRPWLLAMDDTKQPATRRSVSLYHHDGLAWRATDLLPAILARDPSRGFAWGLAGTLTFDRTGRLYVALGTQLDPGGWADASSDIVILSSTDDGRTFDALDIAAPSTSGPAWLASIERPFGEAPIDAPSLLYTRGDPGTTVTGGFATEVFFTRLAVR